MVTEEDKQIFINKLSSDEKYKQRVGENLLLLLNRVDDIRKPKLIANLFSAYVEGKIDDSHYQKLGNAIDTIRVVNLQHLTNYYRGFNGTNFNILEGRSKELEDDVLQDLILCGLIDIRKISELVTYEYGQYSKVSEIGLKFIEVVLKNLVF